ncbi:NAD(P)-dependent oxidoreductase [Pseudonocardia spinosispora]|uniref:NAD(P)-dependent oxidoreductase n=1 Tax=Pseudonocardia spinosispora TaxID=103441 RepID=UPI0003FEF8CC|nr:NAD(P)-dependent oxidoreductase [Pseudonocardia spinosispora]
MSVIGFVGIGRMGTPMCANLVRAGHRVIASDVRPECREVASALGAEWAPTSAGAASGAEVLITMLPGPGEVRQAMIDDGALDALPGGSTWIDMSSNSAAEAAPVQANADERGIHTLEAPVGGGIAAATEGTLQLFVAGDAELVERHRPLLDVLGEPAHVLHIGVRGSGYTAKLLVNLLWFGQAIAVTEALLLARSTGIDLEVLHEALTSSAAASTFIRRDLSSLLDGDYLESFGLDRICEELAALTPLAAEQNVPFELSGLVERIHLRALDRFGPRDGELLAAALLEEQAGLRVRRG